MKRSKRKVKVGRVVRRTLADGTVKEYRYGAYKTPISRVAQDSVEALIREYKKSPDWRSLQEGTRINRSAYLRLFDEIGHLLVKDVIRRDILMIFNAIAETRGNGAANNFRQSASVLFAWAVNQDKILHSPVYEIKKLPGGELPAWTKDQADVALRGLPERLRRVVVFGLYTGQRRGDICKAKWSDYDGETLKFIQQKTDEKLALKVHPDLKAELDRWKMEGAGETILTNNWGKPWLPNTLSITIQRAFRELQLPPGLNVHGMRKLFATGMAENGATVHEIQSNTGHRTIAMVQLYTRSADQRKLSEGAVLKIQSHTNVKKDE